MDAIDRRVWAWLLLSIWLPGLEESFGQDSGPQDIRSARPTEDPIPLVEERGMGVAFPVNLSTEVFGNLSGGTTRTAILESLFIAGMEVDFEMTAGLPGLSLALSGLYAAGTGLTEKAVHDFNTLSNIDTYDSVRLYEAWLQQDFWGEKFSIRIGQILVDSEFFVSDYGALFINSSFGAIPLVSQNLVPPIFPVAAPGLRLRATPNEFLYIQAAAFSGDVGEPGINNKHGTLFSLPGQDGTLLFFELGYRVRWPHIGAAPAPLVGAYKIGGFYDSGRFEGSSGRPSKRGNGGFYLVAEQEVWRAGGNAGRALAFFGRVGTAPDDRNLVPLYFDTGLTFQGILPGRADDTLGLGFSYTQLSDKLVVGRGDEEVVELTYRLALGDHVFLQPDLQFIIHPGATESAATAIVAGLRLNLRY